MSHLDTTARWRLITRRIELGFTQADLAARMHTGPSAISELENGRRDPRIETLNRWAGALGLRPRLEFDELDTARPEAA